MKIIPRSFYERNTIDVAKDLLGQVLVRKISGKIVSGTIVESNLTNGPAKLAQALQITKTLYGEDLTRKSSLYIVEGKQIKKSDIDIRPRIGIRKATDKLWNFRISKNTL